MSKSSKKQAAKATAKQKLAQETIKKGDKRLVKLAQEAAPKAKPVAQPVKKGASKTAGSKAAKTAAAPVADSLGGPRSTDLPSDDGSGGQASHTPTTDSITDPALMDISHTSKKAGKKGKGKSSPAVEPEAVADEVPAEEAPSADLEAEVAPAVPSDHSHPDWSVPGMTEHVHEALQRARSEGFTVEIRKELAEAVAESPVPAGGVLEQIAAPTPARPRTNPLDAIFTAAHEKANTPNAKGKRKKQVIVLDKVYAKKNYGETLIARYRKAPFDFNISQTDEYVPAEDKWRITVTIEPDGEPDA